MRLRCGTWAALVITLVIVLAVAATAVTVLGQQAPATPEAKLGAAQHQAEVEGNLDKAIATFKEVVADRRTSRATAATALLHMADAYQRLGSAQARKIYEQIVKEYADQPAAQTSARQQLATLTGAAQSGVGTDSTRPICSDCVGSFGGSSLSPDGRSILFMSSSDSLVRGREIGSGAEKTYGAEPTDLAKPFAVITPVLSPDSSQIAYAAILTATPAQLRLKATQPGGKHRLLVQNPEYEFIYPRAWSPDGRSILVEITRPDKTWLLAWVSVTDGAVKVLKSLDWRKKGFYDRAALSRDGKYIVYSALATNPRTATAVADSWGMRIYVLAADGTAETEVVDTANYHKSPVWTPDGSHVAFHSDRASGDTNHLDLWIVPIRNGKADGMPVLVNRDVGDLESTVLGVSPSGVLYGTSLPASVTQVLVSEAALTGDQNQRTRTAAAFAGQDPRWSPDGRAIAFLKSESSELVVRSLDGGEEHRAYRDPNLGISGFAWLRDGSGFLVTNRGRQPVLRRVDMRTGDVRELFPLEIGNYALGRVGISVSPDDKTAFFNAVDLTRQKAMSSGSGSFLNMQLSSSLVEVALATGQARRVIDLPNPDLRFGGFAVSPNGRALALLLRSAATDPVDLEEGLTTDQVRLAIVNVDGSSYHELYGPFTQEWFGAGLAWASDDQILFTTTTADHHSRVMRIGVRGGQPEFTGIDVLKSAGPGGVALSPGGGARVAYSVAPNPTRELWALDLSPLLKRRQ